MEKKNWMVTTAIPYVNGNPHLGHALDYLLADALSRYHKILGDEVRFLTGTDEHGGKIYKKSLDSGKSVQDFVDEKASVFQQFIADLGVEYTSNIRTSSKEHKDLCQKIWQKLEDHIYKNRYEGWYCEGCEGFITQKEYDDNGGICPDHQKPYEKLAEDNYYLRISDFKDQLKTEIENDRLLILPNKRKKEFLNLLADMPDVSISRPKDKVVWGIPVPGDEEQVMYVWIDALSNYLTQLGYPDKEIGGIWPPDVQIVGKDILRFHAGIWPVMLFGLNLDLPKTLLTHGFITVDGQKMSKSIGNVVDPYEVISKHGHEAFRHYFLRHASTTEDADFSWDKYEASYLELANVIGNLVQRLANLCMKNSINGRKKATDLDLDYMVMMNECNLSHAFDYAWEKAQKINKRIDEEKPWALIKEDESAGKKLLAELADGIMEVALHLKPFLPNTADRIESIFSAEEIVTPETPLFPKN
ncbi:methionine--tRNA ligase [Candidatus Saccharibacteria bacterium]|nr:methionine--tRNA ligase [Candidatus Saccharibacteria bacterium]